MYQSGATVETVVTKGRRSTPSSDASLVDQLASIWNHTDVLDIVDIMESKLENWNPCWISESE